MQNDTQQESSTINIDIRIEEAWIRKLIRKDALSFTIKDREFNQIGISLNENLLTVSAKVAGKKNSAVGITSRPRWDAIKQQFFVDDVLVQTKTSNLMLKSMGWIASTFMQEKIDERIETYTRQLYERYMESIRSKSIEIPLRGHGVVKAHVKSITIHEVRFVEKAILVKATLEGWGNVALY